MRRTIIGLTLALALAVVLGLGAWQDLALRHQVSDLHGRLTTLQGQVVKLRHQQDATTRAIGSQAGSGIVQAATMNERVTQLSDNLSTLSHQFDQAVPIISCTRTAIDSIEQGSNTNLVC